MPCQLRIGSSAHTGLVLDLSPSGLFIQTHAKTQAGQRLDVTVANTADEPMTLAVQVARRKMVPARLVSVAQGGVGVRILSAPEAYYRFLVELGIAASVPGLESEALEDPAEAGPARAEASRYRVRISQVSGSRSRRLEVEAPDLDTARDRALELTGEGWKVLDVEPL